MIELHLPAPDGFVGARLIVAELDLELEIEPPIPETRSGNVYADFVETVLGLKSPEFTSADIPGFHKTLASTYLNTMAKRLLIERTERKRHVGIGKPYWIYRHLGGKK